MRKAILAVDDDELERELLFQIFGTDYDVILAKDGKEAILQLGKRGKDIVVILLDLVMPVLNGYQVLQVLKSSPNFRDIPIAMVTANTDPSLEVACYTMGAMAVIHKPFSAQIVRREVDNIVEMYHNCRTLKDALVEQTEKLNKFYNNLMDTVACMVEFRDTGSEMHIKRVKGMTEIMINGYVELYPEEGLTEQYRTQVVRAAALHDIGKIVIPDSILLKPGPLTASEREVMCGHTTRGCEMLRLLADVQDDEQYRITYEICRHHHERYDGAGYPDGLKGDDIPFSAQIVSIVDVYDALVSKRIYKQSYSYQKSYDMIVKGECGVFNPKIMRCFQHVREQLEEFSDRMR